MRKILFLSIVVIFAYNGFAQSDSNDYSLEGLANACAKYNRLGSFHDGLAAVEKEGKWGFINKQGVEVIPCKYKEVSSFSEGLARARKTDMYGFINRLGVEVVPFIYNMGNDFREGRALVNNKDDKCGFVDKNGSEVIPCTYQIAFSFSDGLAFVVKDKKRRFIDKNGIDVILYKGKDEPSFHEGLARVEKDMKYGFINKQGVEVIPCKYSQASNFHEGLAYIQTEGYVNEKGDFSETPSPFCDPDTVVLTTFEGFINKEGVVVKLWKMPFFWGDYDTYDLNEGLARVVRGVYGFVDINGDSIPCKYSYADDFHEGVAQIEKDGKNGFIDKSGKEIIPCIYSYAESFSEGLALVKKDGKWGYVDKNGKSTFNNQLDINENAANVDISKVYDGADESPKFDGDMDSWIKANIKYPKDALEQGVGNRVVISFIVERDGSLSNIELVKRVMPSLDEEAIRLVKQMPRWKPGKIKGVPVKVTRSIPITFYKYMNL